VPTRYYKNHLIWTFQLIFIFTIMGFILGGGVTSGFSVVLAGVLLFYAVMCTYADGISRAVSIMFPWAACFASEGFVTTLPNSS
jgi:hypothetical protein